MTADSRSHPIIVVPYDPAWPGLFARHAAEIAAIGSPVILSIEHMGSTSVPGLAAKPVIDLMPVISSFEAAEALIEPMERLGYEYRGEYGIPRRRYFTLRNGDDDRHVHMLEGDSAEARKHIAFRDYLRTNPETAAEYAELKLGLAQQYRLDRDGYTEAKTEFIMRVLALAGWQPT